MKKIFLIILALFCFSCGDEEVTTKESISLSINGQTYEWEMNTPKEFISAGMNDENIFLISGINIDESATVQIFIKTNGGMPQKGSSYTFYTITPADQANPETFANVTIGTKGYSSLISSSQKQNIGTVKFDDISSKKCSGTFSFKVANAGGVLDVTNGVFNVPITE